jgi:hypothetical protein
MHKHVPFVFFFRFLFVTCVDFLGFCFFLICAAGCWLFFGSVFLVPLRLLEVVCVRVWRSASSFVLLGCIFYHRMMMTWIVRFLVLKPVLGVIHFALFLQRVV